MEKQFIVLTGHQFLSGSGELVNEYPEAKLFASEAAAIKSAKKLIESGTRRVWFTVYTAEDYAADGEPVHIEYNLNNLSAMEVANAVQS